MKSRSEQFERNLRNQTKIDRIKLGQRVIGIVVSCCAADIALLFASANGMLGPGSFDLMYLGIAASFVGAILLPVGLGSKIGWKAALAGALALFALGVLNIWCVYDASAAV